MPVNSALLTALLLVTDKAAPLCTQGPYDRFAGDFADTPAWLDAICPAYLRANARRTHSDKPRSGPVRTGWAEPTHGGACATAYRALKPGGASSWDWHLAASSRRGQSTTPCPS